MTNDPLILERVTRVAPLGIRFWDAVTGTFIRQGLDVIAYPAINPALKTAPIVTLSGVYAFIHLPGLRDFENGSGDDAFWKNLPAARPLIIQVTDQQKRFQEFQFTADVPARGIYTLECASSPLSPPDFDLTGIPLFSSPARQAPGGMAVLHASLRDMAADVPAAYARLEAELDGRILARAFADRQGRLTMILPYPEPPFVSIGSPLGGRRPLSRQSWTVNLHAYYSPQARVPDIPDLCMLFNQRAADMVQSLSPFTSLTQTTLEFGQEGIVKTQSQPVLSIAPT